MGSGEKRKKPIRLSRWPWLYLLKNDATFRGMVSLHGGMMVNMLYAAFKLVASCIYKSEWFAAVAGYYLLLCVARGMLIYTQHTARHLQGKQRIIWIYRGYRRCGFLMLGLDMVMSAVIAQMIVRGEGYQYPGVLIYAAAFYAFYMLILAADIGHCQSGAFPSGA